MLEESARQLLVWVWLSTVHLLVADTDNDDDATSIEVSLLSSLYLEVNEKSLATQKGSRLKVLFSSPSSRANSRSSSTSLRDRKPLQTL